MSKVVNLTPAVLRRIIQEEKARIAKSKSKKMTGKSRNVNDAVKQTREVEASEMAGTLANKVEHYKNLQREAARLARRLSEINEARQEIRSEILEDL